MALADEFRVRETAPMNFSLKNTFIAVATSLLTLTSSHAATVFWSFETTTDGTGPVTLATTAVEGFQGTPVLTQFAGGASTATIGNGNGGTTFTDFQGTTWQGSGGTNTPGHSISWDATGTNLFTGSGFQISLNTTGLSDFNMRFDIRSAGGSGTPPTQFTSVQYSLNNGAWVNTGLTGSWTTGAFTASTLDLSSITAINNQSDVRLRFNFEPGTKSASVTHSIRVDNIQLTAVPEPSSAALLGLGLGAICIMRRRRKA